MWLAERSISDEVPPEGLCVSPLGAFRAGIMTPFIASSFAWYWATASPVDCFSWNAVDCGDCSVLLLLVGDDV